jgi:uncharacterized metal-binding protein
MESKLDLQNNNLALLSQVFDDMPPKYLLDKYTSVGYLENFLRSKYNNLLVKSRIAAFFSGENIALIPPPGLEKVVASVASYQIARYKLLFEVWCDFKPIAISQRLIAPDATPKDCIKQILEQEHEMAAEKFEKSGRGIKKRALNDRCSKALNTNRYSYILDSLPEIERKSIEKSILAGDKLKPKLQIILEDVAMRARKKNDLVREAERHAKHSLFIMLNEVKDYCHHKNSTRNIIKKG